MKVTEIIVSAGRTFNHPYEQYSNLRPQVTLKATVDEGEDPAAAAQALQAKAEQLVEDHKRNMLQTIHELYHLSEAKREIYDTERRLRDLAAKMEQLRTENPQLAPPTGKEDLS